MPVYAYMYGYVDIYTHTCVYTHIYMYTYKYIYPRPRGIGTSACTCMSMYVHAHTFMYGSIYKHVKVCMGGSKASADTKREGPAQSTRKSLSTRMPPQPPATRLSRKKQNTCSGRDQDRGRASAKPRDPHMPHSVAARLSSLGSCTPWSEIGMWLLGSSL